MSTSAVTPFRSFVQTPIFSVPPSSFRVSSRYIINIIYRGQASSSSVAQSFTQGRSSLKRNYSPYPLRALFSCLRALVSCRDIPVCEATVSLLCCFAVFS